MTVSEDAVNTDRHESPKTPTGLTQRALLRSSLVIYPLMGFVGFEICWWYHRNVQALFAWQDLPLARFAAIVLTSLGFLSLGQLLLEDFFPSYRRLKWTFAQLFKDLKWHQIFVLAALSSLGEEILFRGAIQPFLGVWITSIIFALLHTDPEGKISVWTLWAFVGGLVMGYATYSTGSLYPAIAIHFAVNFISIRRVSQLIARSERGLIAAADSATSNPPIK